MGNGEMYCIKKILYIRVCTTLHFFLTWTEVHVKIPTTFFLPQILDLRRESLEEKRKR